MPTTSLSFVGQTLVFDPFTALINLALALVLSLVIAWVYKATHRGLSYSQTFVITLVMGGVVIAAVMMVIGNNVARAFGAFGAFSLIRFRTAVKDTKDMGFIFLVLAVGMAIGTNNYFIGAALTLIALAVVAILQKINFGSLRRYDYLLHFQLDTKQAKVEDYRAVFDGYLKSSRVLNMKALEDGTILRMNFSVKFIHDAQAGEFSRALAQLKGIGEVNLITAKNDVEY
ncbi:MAG: DUF4956 domain-containing protein [Patescibacteria group bacterium]